MSLKRIFAFALLLGATLWLHWLIAWTPALSFIRSSSGGGNIAAAILHSPGGLRALGGQIVGIALLYAAFFTAIVWLSRPHPGEARRFRGTAWPLVITWTSALWILLRLHSFEFPNSLWAKVPDPEAGGVALYLADAMAAIWLAWRAWLAIDPVRRWRKIAVAGLVAFVAWCAWSGCLSWSGSSRPDGARAPDVVVIGLDSLRRDIVLNASAETLPALARFRERAYVQSGVVSSLARTYPSWASLLSGRAVRDGVRENHAPTAGPDAEASLAWTFGKAGYQTVFATDDTQFSYLGPEFGFETFLGPQPGVANFVLTRFADLPLVNYAIQLPGSGWLLPALAGNRAFAHAYRPQRFVERLVHGVRRSGDRPLLLAMHLCALHWPFTFADSDGGADYETAVQVLDRQLGAILASLPAMGIDPDRSVVVLLPDHGDSGDAVFLAHREVVGHSTGIDPGVGAAGHGATLLDPLQWRTFMLFAGRGASGPIAHGESAQLASLQDFSATIEALAGLPTQDRPVLDVARQGNDQLPRVEHATIGMETGLRAAKLDLLNPDLGVAAQMAATAYRVLPSGQLQLTDSAYASAIAEKDLGVTDDRTSLVSLWRPEGFLLVSEDFSKLRLDVYPGVRPQGVDSPPLLEQACLDTEIRTRHPTWCGDERAENAAALPQERSR